MSIDKTRQDLIEIMASASWEKHTEHPGTDDDPWLEVDELVQDEVREEAEAALKALEKLGFAVVPKIPTKEMAAVIDRVIDRFYLRTVDASSQQCGEAVYSAMVEVYSTGELELM